MKICVITPLFAIAGVPLAQIRFAQALAKRGHNVDLVIGYVDSNCHLPDIIGVNVLIWNKPKVRSMFFKIWNYLRVVKPEVVFSAEDHLNAFVLLAAVLSGSKSKISGSSRVLPSDPVAYSKTFLSKGWFLKQLMRVVMWRADALTCVSKDMVGHYQHVFNSPPHTFVYNIICDNNSVYKMQESISHDWFLNKNIPVIVTAGTMTERKGFSDLVHAISIVCKNRIVRLIILGDGDLRNNLELLIESLGLKNNVLMPGNVTNPLKYFYNSDVFVLSSYAEGMPNVLVEAMMCGCTPVATDCPTGPRELLQDGRYGYLVPMRSPIAMAKAIEQALDNPIPSSILAQAVLPFEESAVIDRHFEILGLS